MHALAHHETHPERLHSTRLFQYDCPWILLKNTHKRVNYEFTTMGPGLDEQGNDCIALSFASEFSFEPGTEMNIGVPLPDAMRDYSGEVVACMDTTRGYDVTLLIKIETDTDLLTLMRSNAYLSSRYND